MMKTVAFPTLLAALTATGLASPASGIVLSTLIDETFESYTISEEGDNNPTNPGDGNPNDWLLTQPSVIQVAAGSSTNGSGDNAQILKLDDPVGSDSTVLRRSFDAQAVGAGQPDLRVSFKIMFNDTSLATDWRFAVVGNSAIGQSAAYIRFRPNNTSAATGGFSVQGEGVEPGGDEDTRQSTGIEIQAGDWYQVVIDLNMSTSQFVLNVQNLDDDAAGQTGQSAPLYFRTALESVNQIWLSNVTANGAPIDAHIDDILVQTIIPEPGSVGLLSLGLLAIMVRRR